MDPKRSQSESVARPPGGLKLLSGPPKSSPVEDPMSLKLADGLSRPGPVVLLHSNEAAVVKDRPVSLKDFWWANEEENNKATGTDKLDSSPGPSQPPLVDNAQNSLAHSLVRPGPSNWSNSGLEFINL